MKNTIICTLAVTFILAILTSNIGFAQSNATAGASATIVTPITITKTVDMNFGNIAVQAVGGGTVVLAASGTRSATSGVTLPAVSGTVTAASFDIAGQANYTYAITLPSSATVIYDAGQTHNMTVDTWTSSPSATGTLSGTGTQTLKVGALLHVGAGQAPGMYTSGTDFTVTVNYN
jgi:hypothetical protein